jgi:hypothetical protein
MDRTNKILLALAMCSLITTIVSSHYIPPTGGTIPQNETSEEFNNRQRQFVYSSIPFKITMSFLVFTVVFLSIVGYRYNKIEGHSEEVRWRAEARPRSILKVTRSQVAPIVEDPKPEVRTSPQLVSLPPPSSSPPIQFVPRGPVIQNIPRIQKQFLYPPPYDVLNR